MAGSGDFRMALVEWWFAVNAVVADTAVDAAADDAAADTADESADGSAADTADTVADMVVPGKQQGEALFPCWNHTPRCLWVPMDSPAAESVLPPK